MTAPANGAELVARRLRDWGADVVFGLPGTQTLSLHEAFRRGRVRSILAVSEVSACFSAQGYSRVSGRPGVVVATPGPGVAMAVPGLAEAALDSIPLVLLTADPPGETAGLRQQELPQRAMLEPLVKAYVEVDGPDDVAAAIDRAFRTALFDGPGPVVVQFSRAALEGAPGDEPAAPDTAPPTGDAADAAVDAFLGARRPILLLGQGAEAAADRARALVERTGAPVLTSGAARGLVPEDDPRALRFDGCGSDVGALNRLIERADLVFALGARLGHNGTAAYGLRVPAEKLVHVDSDRAAHDRAYPARLALAADAGTVLDALLEREPGRSEWTEAEIDECRRSLPAPAAPEPAVHGVQPATAAGFFDLLRQAMPRDGVLVTDSGLHQVLCRKYYDVHETGGLIVPTDLQSMGFGVPAAIGAKVAAPERPVVALLGDGGFAMSGLAMLTALRERIPLTVVVWNDGKLAQIRMQQIRDFGATTDVSLHNPDFETLAAALGADYLALADVSAEELGAVIRSGRITLVEVALGDSAKLVRRRVRNAGREIVRRALGGRVVAMLRRLKR